MAKQEEDRLMEMVEERDAIITSHDNEIAEQYELIERLRTALHKCDKWGNHLENLYEDGFISPTDMGIHV